MTKTANKRLLELIKARQQKNANFLYGIHTADAYVRRVQECVGIDACNKFAATKSCSFNDVITKAANTLTYSNEDMAVDYRYDTKKVNDELPSDLELPKNTLMVFRHTLTTPRKDRDGDILRTQGAKLDPKMLLLWQHVHTLPIGKLLVITNHNSKKLEVISCIVDKLDLAHDAAVMIDNDMGRFSHGFRALEFSKMKATPGDPTGEGGFDVTSFEIMEESLVSVPSNADADTHEVILSLVEGGKMTSPLMKAEAKYIREHRPTFVSGIDMKNIEGYKHTPSGHDHDQSTHGGGGGGYVAGSGIYKYNPKDTEGNQNLANSTSARADTLSNRIAEQGNVDIRDHRLAAAAHEDASRMQNNLGNEELGAYHAGKAKEHWTAAAGKPSYSSRISKSDNVVPIDIQLTINGKAINNDATEPEAETKGTGDSCHCGGTCDSCSSEKTDAKAKGEKPTGADDKEMICPDCGSKMVDGMCEKCGYAAKKSVKHTPSGHDHDQSTHGGGGGGAAKEGWSDTTKKAVEATKKAAKQAKMEADRRRKGPNATKEVVSASKATNKASKATSEAAKPTGRGIGPDQDAHNYAWSMHTDAAKAWEKVGTSFIVELHEIAAATHKEASISIWNDAHSGGKSFEKSGRTLSRSNISVLKEIRDDIAGVPKGDYVLGLNTKAVCEKCAARLTKMIDDYDMDNKQEPKEAAPLTVKDAITLIATKATSEERNSMKRVLVALELAEARDVQAKQYRSLVGASP